MEIFSLNDEILTRDTICYFIQPEIVEIKKSQLSSKVPYVQYVEEGFYNLCSNSSGIYVKYIPREEMDKISDKTTIYKFSWAGDLICKFILDGEFFSFTISEDDTFAYAFKRVDNVPYLCRINL